VAIVFSSGRLDEKTMLASTSSNAIDLWCFCVFRAIGVNRFVRMVIANDDDDILSLIVS